MTHIDTENAIASELGCLVILSGSSLREFKATRGIYDALVADMMKDPSGLVRFELEPNQSTVIRLSAIDEVRFNTTRFMVDHLGLTVRAMTTFTPAPMGVFPRRGHS